MTSDPAQSAYANFIRKHLLPCHFPCSGIASKSDALVPNPVRLTPYRTFLEVEQPASDFIFRMKQDKYEGIVCAIFEADGGAWKMEATQRIKEYLQKELMEYPYITVIS